MSAGREETRVEGRRVGVRVTLVSMGDGEEVIHIHLTDGLDGHDRTGRLIGSAYSPARAPQFTYAAGDDS